MCGICCYIFAVVLQTMHGIPHRPPVEQPDLVRLVQQLPRMVDPHTRAGLSVRINVCLASIFATHTYICSPYIYSRNMYCKYIYIYVYIYIYIYININTKIYIYIYIYHIYINMRSEERV